MDYEDKWMENHVGTQQGFVIFLHTHTHQATKRIFFVWNHYYISLEWNLISFNVSSLFLWISRCKGEDLVEDGRRHPPLIWSTHRIRLFFSKVPCRLTPYINKCRVKCILDILIRLAVNTKQSSFLWTQSISLERRYMSVFCPGQRSFFCIAFAFVLAH